MIRKITLTENHKLPPEYTYQVPHFEPVELDLVSGYEGEKKPVISHKLVANFRIRFNRSTGVLSITLLPHEHSSIREGLKYEYHITNRYKIATNFESMVNEKLMKIIYKK